MSLNIAQELIDCLLEHRIHNLFTLSGNQILSLYDATISRDLHLIHTRHEATAVHMADAWGRLVETTPGVAMVTAGPGHCNTIGALYIALLAESPVVLISGHSPIGQLGQGAFQEMDQVATASPVTKASWRVNTPEEAVPALEKALSIAVCGKPGPIHISIPSDILEAPNTKSDKNESLPEDSPKTLCYEQISQVHGLLLGAERPLILAGPAMSRPLRWKSVLELSRVIGIPAIKMESPRGINDPRLYRGAKCLGQADLVLLLGKQLDFALRFGGSPFSDNCQFIIIDAQESCTPIHPKVVISLSADPREAACSLARQPCKRLPLQNSWFQTVESARSEKPAKWEDWCNSSQNPLHPLRVCEGLRPFLNGDSVVISDGGEFGQWVQAGLGTQVNLINGPSGAIGSSIPMALASKLARPHNPVFVLLGDGTFGYHAMEFDTALRYQLPFVAVVGNDSRWNAEYQLQLDKYGPERAIACELLPTRYDKIIEAMGGHGEFVSNPDHLEPALQRAIASGRPACVNVTIEGMKAPTF